MFLTVQQRNQLVLDYMPLARSLAYHYKKPKHITHAEILSAAYLGLVEAATSYEPWRYASFMPHCRILGAIQDYLRAISWGTRTKRVSVLSFEDCEKQV